MTRRSPAPWIPWLLGALTLFILINLPSAPTQLEMLDLRMAIALIGVVAFFVNVEVPLPGDAVSLGYSAGLLTYLMLGHAGLPNAVLLITAIGGVAGSILRFARLELREPKRKFRITRYLIECSILAAAQLTLSILAGDRIYQWLGGHVPVNALLSTDLLPLIILVIVSAAVYLGIYALSLWWRDHPVRVFLTHNAAALALTLLAPLPLVIGAALLYQPQQLGGFAILVAGLLALAIWGTEVGHSQLRYRQQLIELQSISAVNRAIKTYLELGALLEAIYLQVASLMKVSDFTLALYNPTENLVTFPLVMHHHQRGSVASRELGQGLIDYVIKHKAALLLSDKPGQRAQAMGLLAPNSGPDSWLGVPLTASERALGCIAVAVNDQRVRYTERDQRLLTGIAIQASIAIENALLYNQSTERARQLARLNSLAAQLSGTLKPDHVFDQVLQAATAITSATGAALFLWWDKERKVLAVARSLGLTEQFTSSTPHLLTPEQNINILAIQNVQADTRTSAIREALLVEGINAWVELALRHGDEVLGTLALCYRAPRPFSGDELELMQTFANQAALAISNALLYGQVDDALERRVEQLSALADINRELSTLFNLDTLFKLVLDHALEATRSNGGVLLLHHEAQDEPRIVARRTDTPMTTSELIALHAYTQASTLGQPVIERNGSLPNGMKGRLSVPIVRDYDVLGVIILQTRSINAYPPEDVAFVKQLAAQAAIAIENVRMFEWMQDNRDRLQVILDSMHEAVLMFSTDGRISLANPRVEHLLNLAPAILTGERIQNLIARPELLFAERLGFDPKTLCDLFDALSLESLPGGARFSYRFDQPQTRFIDRTIVPIFNHNKRIMGLLMVFTDATEERQLAQTREDLSRMIVHDLRGPLTAINASMKLLNELSLNDNPLGASIRRTTDVSQRALHKLLRLVNSLLDIAKMESGNLTLEVKQVRLRTIAENVRLELLPLAEELTIRIDLLMLDDLPFMRIDEDKIERVLLNLVDNALKFTPIGGLIQVRARLDREHSSSAGSFVRVEVTDTGPGIPDKSKIRIFDRFQQVDGSAKGHRRGTGLGLTFCKLAIEAHSGRIWIEDNPGGGSIFAFTLPTVEPMADD